MVRPSQAIRKVRKSVQRVKEAVPERDDEPGGVAREAQASKRELAKLAEEAGVRSKKQRVPGFELRQDLQEFVGQGRDVQQELREMDMQEQAEDFATGFAMSVNAGGEAVQAIEQEAPAEQRRRGKVQRGAQKGASAAKRGAKKGASLAKRGADAFVIDEEGDDTRASEAFLLGGAQEAAGREGTMMGGDRNQTTDDMDDLLFGP